MVIERCFFSLHFWPFKTHWTGQKSCFLIRRVLKKPFFYLTFPRGSCFAKIRVSCQTFKMVIERCFYLIPHFWPFKNHWTCQKSCFLIRRVWKGLFPIWPPPGGLVLPKYESVVKLSKWSYRYLFFLPSIFDHLKATGQVRNHVFSSEEC